MHQSANQFSFTHHRVEVDAVAGHPHSGAQAKTGGDHAPVAVLVDGDDVGRLSPFGRCSQAVDQHCRRVCISLLDPHPTTGATRSMVAEQVIKIIPRACTVKSFTRTDRGVDSITW